MEKKKRRRLFGTAVFISTKVEKIEAFTDEVALVSNGLVDVVKRKLIAEKKKIQTIIHSIENERECVILFMDKYEL